MSYKAPEAFQPLELNLKKEKVTSLQAAERVIFALHGVIEKMRQHINQMGQKLNNNEVATARAIGTQKKDTEAAQTVIAETLTTTPSTPVSSYAQAFQTVITTAPGVVTVTMPKSMSNATYQVPVARLISAAGSVSDAIPLYPPHFNPLTGVEAVDSRTTTAFDVYVEENGVLICAVA